MFDSILKRNTLPKPKYGTALCIAATLHATALLGALSLPTKHPPPINHSTEILLYKSLPPTIPAPHLTEMLPPPLPLPVKTYFQNQTLQKNKISALGKTKPVLTEKFFEKKPETLSADNSEMAPLVDNKTAHPLGATHGVEGGGLGPSPLSQTGPTGTPSLATLPFGEGMVPPRALLNRPVRFSRKALEARVEGLALVRCTITAQGNVENCRFIQSLPYMEEAILSALYMRKYSPATFQGKPISVDYNIPIRLKLP